MNDYAKCYAHLSFAPTILTFRGLIPNPSPHNPGAMIKLTDINKLHF